MKTSESLLSKGKFIAEYSAHLMGAGVHTSRVVRNSKRIGEAFGLDVKLGVFHKNIILTIIDKQTNEACNEVIDIPAHPISFEQLGIKCIELGSRGQSPLVGRTDGKIQENSFRSDDTSSFCIIAGRICQCFFL